MKNEKENIDVQFLNYFTKLNQDDQAQVFKDLFPNGKPNKIAK